MTLFLRDIAHARAGDKSDTLNICVIAYTIEQYKILERELTKEKVGLVFNFVKGEIQRYCVPSIKGMNFVMLGALRGGVTRSLALDPHGKTLSSLFLDMKIEDAHE